MTRQQLIEGWNKRSVDYDKLAAKAELGDFNDSEIEQSVHYRLMADTFKMCATQLSHLKE